MMVQVPSIYKFSSLSSQSLGQVILLTTQSLSPIVMAVIDICRKKRPLHRTNTTLLSHTNKARVDCYTGETSALFHSDPVYKLSALSCGAAAQLWGFAPGRFGCSAVTILAVAPQPSPSHRGVRQQRAARGREDPFINWVKFHSLTFDVRVQRPHRLPAAPGLHPRPAGGTRGSELGDRDSEFGLGARGSGLEFGSRGPGLGTTARISSFAESQNKAELEGSLRDHRAQLLALHSTITSLYVVFSNGLINREVSGLKLFTSLTFYEQVIYFHDEQTLAKFSTICMLEKLMSTE
nr:uncharacterized protein LOC115494889 [Taeniopygia guttata]